MIEYLLVIVIGFLLILASISDLRFRAVPSAILTAGILAVFLLRPENLYFGVGALIFSLLIRDLIDDFAGLEFGTADIKVFVIIGLMISTLQGLFIMIGVFLVFQFVYTLVWRLNIPMEEEDPYIPFLPCLLAVYLVLAIVGVVA